MPTYDYVCKFCEHTFEHFQGINDKLLKKCPECARQGLTRLFGTGAGVVFKGSGFYETDYKRAGKSDSGSGESKPRSSESGSSSSGSDSGSGSGSGKKDGKGDGGKPSSGSGQKSKD